MHKPSPMLEPVRVRSLQEEVITRVKDFIISNRLQPGDRLPPEDELARRLGVSRTAVREALRALEALGIVVAKQGAGRYVRPFSFDPIVENLPYSLLYDLHTFEELLEVREKLECGFLEEVVRDVDSETVQLLQDVVSRMRRKLGDGCSADELLEDDVEFHRILYRNVRNSLLHKLLGIFWNVQKRLRLELQAVEETPQDLADMVRRHEALVEAVAAGDLELARRRLKEHFEGVRRWIRHHKAYAERR